MNKHDQIRNLNAFDSSIRDFANLFYPRIKGGTDIDFMYERKGNILIIEGKRIMDGILKITYGQWKALYTLSKYPKIMILIAGENDLGFYVRPITHIKLPLYDEIYQGFSIDVNQWKFFKRNELVEFIGKMCDSYEHQ